MADGKREAKTLDKAGESRASKGRQGGETKITLVPQNLEKEKEKRKKGARK